MYENARISELNTQMAQEQSRIKESVVRIAQLESMIRGEYEKLITERINAEEADGKKFATSVSHFLKGL